MTKLPQSNIYSASAEEISGLFGDYLEGDAACPMLVISERRLGDAARDALAKTFSSFGYGDGRVCMYATLLPAGGEGEAGVAIDSQALFLLVEGLDPVCVVVADAVSATCLEGAYRTSFEIDAAARVFGRSAAVFGDLNALMATEDGKQRAWHVLKSLPRR